MAVKEENKTIICTKYENTWESRKKCTINKITQSLSRILI